MLIGSETTVELALEAVEEVLGDKNCCVCNLCFFLQFVLSRIGHSL